MIRFSERHAGQFAISYVQGGLVKHYLVQPTDTAGARKTLGDFVLEQAQYVYIVGYRSLRGNNSLCFPCILQIYAHLASAI